MVVSSSLESSWMVEKFSPNTILSYELTSLVVKFPTISIWELCSPQKPKNWPNQLLLLNLWIIWPSCSLRLGDTSGRFWAPVLNKSRWSLWVLSMISKGDIDPRFLFEKWFYIEAPWVTTKPHNLTLHASPPHSNSVFRQIHISQYSFPLKWS
jgi:hypothetical protein